MWRPVRERISALTKSLVRGGSAVRRCQPSSSGHFGLVSDFLSECFFRLRVQNRLSTVHGRVSWGGALSGRDNGVNKTVSGLLKASDSVRHG